MSTPTGVWAQVADVDGDVVSLAVAPFTKDLPYTTVPFIGVGGHDPVEGDRAFLHFTTVGRPAYAVVFPT